MHKLNEQDQKTLDAIVDRFQESIETLANFAVAKAMVALKVRFPKRRFRMDFYNGDSVFRVGEKFIRIYWNPSSESVVWDQPNGRGAIIPSSWSMEIEGAKVNPLLFEELCVLEDELMQITDGFSRGCPDAVDSATRTEWTIPAGVTP